MVLLRSVRTGTRPAGAGARRADARPAGGAPAMVGHAVGAPP
ncbi:hypothetical protein ACFSM7_10575 [Clavibacter michiganensis subsp. tessellarius]